MAQATQSYKPPWSVIMWLDPDETQIFIEVPTKAEPYITTFTMSEGGLSKALHYLKVVNKIHNTGRRKTNGAAQHSLTKVLKPSAKVKEKFTDEQHDRAKSILKKMGLI